MLPIAPGVPHLQVLLQEPPAHAGHLCEAVHIPDVPRTGAHTQVCHLPQRHQAAEPAGQHREPPAEALRLWQRQGTALLQPTSATVLEVSLGSLIV